jgi:hypothetical protein
MEKEKKKMPVKSWRTKRGWCAKWGETGKVYCRKTRQAAIQAAKKQAKAIYATGWKDK